LRSEAGFLSRHLQGAAIEGILQILYPASP
jgi:hypothetical protein